MYGSRSLFNYPFTFVGLHYLILESNHVFIWFGLSRTVLSDPRMRHEYDIQGNYGLQDYNYTVSNKILISCLYHAFLVLWAVEFSNMSRSDAVTHSGFAFKRKTSKFVAF